MQKRPSALKRALALVSVAALGLTGAVTLSTAASAATANVPTEDGSLTIHKFAQPETSGPANNGGAPLEDSVTSAWEALGRVVFDVQKITDVDLTTTEGWTTASGYAQDPASIPADSLSDATQHTTSTDAADFGTIEIDKLTIGAYLVTERDFSNAVNAAGDLVSVTIGSAPFVITVPVPTGDGGWNSDVHVYPKNSVSTSSKAVSDPDEDNVVTWTIEFGPINIPDGQALESFEIVDKLDSRLNVADDFAPKVELVTDAGDRSDLAYADSGYDEDAHTVTLNLTDAALEAIAAAPGSTVVVTFDTEVIGDGAIENEAEGYINDPEHEAPLKPKATTYWSSLNIVKLAAGDEESRLAGATFTLHGSADDAASGANPIAALNADGETATEFTTGENGEVTVSRIYIGTGDDPSRTVWLREIEAPAGYVLPAEDDEIPSIELTASGAENGFEIAVENSQQPAFSLPMTGGTGTAMLMFGGIALMVTAAGVALIIARRHRQEVTER